jgi:NADH dehydrogenase
MASQSPHKTDRKIFLGARQHVAIVGANFAGLKTALQLPSDLKVTLLDPSPAFEYLPNIHELVSGVKRPENLRISKNRIIGWAGHRFICDTVLEIDPIANRLVTAGGKRIRFDILVVATGGVNNTFGVKGAQTHAWPFKTVNNCREIGEQIRRRAIVEKDLNLVIVGGGLEGIEALGEILRRYRKHAGLGVHMVERNQRMISDAPPVLDQEIRNLCRHYRVTFHNDVSVSQVNNHSVEISTGIALDSDLTIWTGGSKPPGLLFQSGLCETPNQWAPVKETLQSRFFEHVFVAGDAAQLKTPISKQAYHAMDMGTWAAANLRRLISGEPLKPFCPAEKPMLVSFGDLTTFLSDGASVFSGASLAAVKEGIFQYTMAQMQPPLGILPAWEMLQRLKAGALNLFLPSVTSLSALKRIPEIRQLQ